MRNKSMMKRLLGILALVALAGLAAGCPEPVVKDDGPKEPIVQKKSADEWFQDGVVALQATPPDWVKARTAFEQAVNEDGNFYEARVNLAMVAEAQGDYGIAIENYGMAISMAPAEDDEAHISLNTGQGRAYLKSGDTKSAIESFRNALSRDLENLEALNNMAIAYLQQNEFERAIEMVDEVLTYDSQNVVGLNTKGRVFYKQEKYALALYLFERANKVDPSNPNPINNMGLIAVAEGKIPTAVSRFREAIAVDANFVPAHLNVGSIYLDFLDYSAAVENFRVAYEIEPANPIAQLGFAAALYGAGDYEKAAEVYEVYAADNPKSLTAAERLATLYELYLENAEKACDWYNVVVELKPDDPEVPVLRDLVCKNAGK